MKRSWVLLILNVLLIIPLAIYAYSAIHMRLFRDELALFLVLKRLGVWGATIYWYESWNGRIFANFMINVLLPMGQNVQAAFKIGLIGVWWVGLFSLFRRLFVNCPQRGLYSGTMASLTALTFFQGLPSIPLAIYWQNTVLIYFVPVVIFTYYLIALLNTSRLSNWLCLILAFCAGAYVEVFTLAQLILFVVAYILIATKRFSFTRQDILPKLRLSIAGGIVILGLMLLAPGNWARASASVHDISGTLSGAASSAAIPLLYLVVHAFPAVIGLVLLPSLIIDTERTSRQGRIVSQAQAAFVLLFYLVISGICFAIPIFFTQQPLPYYGWSIPTFLTVLMLAAVGYIVANSGWGLRFRNADSIVGGLLVLATVLGCNNAIVVEADMRQFQQAWDARDAQIRLYARPDAHLEAPALSVILSQVDLFSDPNAGANMSMAAYYGIASIQASPSGVVRPISDQGSAAIDPPAP